MNLHAGYPGRACLVVIALCAVGAVGAELLRARKPRRGYRSSPGSGPNAVP
jgi:hypothetical protein